MKNWDWRTYFEQNCLHRCSDQFTDDVALVLGEMSKVDPFRVYLEIGCQRLGTFSIYHRSLPSNGLAIGLDLNPNEWWDKYSDTLESNTAPYHLVPGDSSSQFTVDCVEKLLGGRQVDVLFIDGDHSEKGVKADWELYSPLVRQGGLVIFHDWDPPAASHNKDTQGAGIVCRDLGLPVHQLHGTRIGTAILRMP